MIGWRQKYLATLSLGAVMSSSSAAVVDDRLLRPAHSVCERKVEVPTISVEEKDGRRTVVVQWFGKASSAELKKDDQFLFPFTTGVDAIQWFGHPEQFRVSFLGQIKNWPNPEAIPQLLEGFKSEDAWVFMVASSLYSRKTQRGVVCACFMGAIVMLGDPNVGVITPVPFYDERVNLEEQAKVEQMQK